jgi:hypothetical protein
MISVADATGAAAGFVVVVAFPCTMLAWSSWAVMVWRRLRRV